MAYTLKQNLGSPPNLNAGFGWDGMGWMASSFTANDTYTLTKVAVSLLLGDGSPLTSALSCFIYSDNSGEPGTLLGTATNTHSDTLGVSPAYYDFTFAGVSLSNAARYWVVLKVTTTDNNDYPMWESLSGGTTEITMYSDDGTLWYFYASDTSHTFKLYSGTDAQSISSVITLPSLSESIQLYDNFAAINSIISLPSLSPSIIMKREGYFQITSELTLPSLNIGAAVLANTPVYIDSYISTIIPGMIGRVYGGGLLSFILSDIQFEATGRVGMSGSLDVPLSFSVLMTGYQAPRGTFLGSLGIIFSASGHVGETFDALVINVKNNALTRYLNYNFNSMCVFNGKFIAASNSGIFELDGDTDNNSPIPWKFRTAYLDLEGVDYTNTQINYKKSLRYIWLGYRTSGDLILSILTQDGEQYDYLVESVFQDSDGGIRVKVGKGIKSRYVQIEMSNLYNETLMLDKMRVFVELSKKKR